MIFVSYFAVKAMLLIIDCKYKILKVVDFEGRHRSTEKVKTVNGNSYVEVKCSDVDEEITNCYKFEHQQRNRSRSRSSETSQTDHQKQLPVNESVNYSDIGYAAYG